MMILLPMLLTGAVDQLDDQFAAWDSCLNSKAKAYATLDEPAETIATATISACSAQEVAIRDSGPSTGDAEVLKARRELMDSVVQTKRRGIIQLVMDQRLSAAGTQKASQRRASR